MMMKMMAVSDEIMNYENYTPTGVENYLQGKWCQGTNKGKKGIKSNFKPEQPCFYLHK